VGVRAGPARSRTRDRSSPSTSEGEGEMDKNCVRFVGAACVLSMLILGAMCDIADADSMMIESYEYYIDTIDLRLSWIAIDRVPPLTIDLESSDGIKGPAQHGTKYMRVNYLYSPSIIYSDMGGVDWSTYEFLRLWYRGIPNPFNDVIELQVELVGSSDSWFGPIEPDVSTCVSLETYCEWQEHIVDFSEWPGIGDVQEVRLHVLTQMGNAEFYIDALEVFTSPVGSEQSTWSSVKALYH